MTKQPLQSEFIAPGPEETSTGDAPVLGVSPDNAPSSNGKRTCERHEIDIWGRFRNGGRGYEVVLLDLSTKGCRFFDRHGQLEIGTQIRLKIAGIGPFEAEVRWRERGYVGVKFCIEMYGPVLDHIVALSTPKS